jgi:hypothetical protein
MESSSWWGHLYQYARSVSVILDLGLDSTWGAFKNRPDSSLVIKSVAEPRLANEEGPGRAVSFRGPISRTHGKG